MISILVPCYNEETNVATFYDKTINVIKHMSIDLYEFIFINDGSRDFTLTELKKLSERDKHVKYLSFSRNFGKEAAIYAGLEYAQYEYITLMDVDLQDPPDLLPDMYALLQTGEYDCVGTRRVDRKGEGLIRSFFSRQFYRLVNRISKLQIAEGTRDYRMMTKDMASALVSMHEKNRFSKGLFAWIGFRTKYLEYSNVERVAGSSKWSFWQLSMYALDGISSFSTVPLYWVAIGGGICCVLAILLIMFFVLQKVLCGINAEGWATMMTLILLLGGIQLLGMGILGLYMAKIYLEIKDRPIYIIDRKNSTFKDTRL